jgi:glycosyltransferase involved in cell wall biosynthesis
MVRILLVSKLLSGGEKIGGQYWFTLGLFTSLENAGFDVWLMHNSHNLYSKKNRDILLPYSLTRSDLTHLLFKTLLYPKVIKTIRPHIIHGVDESITNYMIFSNSIVKVATVTDIIPIILPKLFSLRFRWALRISISIMTKFCDKIIVISRSVAEDLVKICKVPHSKIDIVYPSIDPIFRPMPKSFCQKIVKEKYSIKDPYILYAGSAAPNKNVPRLLEAYRILHTQTSDKLSLVLTLITSPILIKGDDKFTLPKINRQDLPCVYGAAEALVVPSLVDGFSLPAVEAMACGTPVIASDIPLFHEILGDAALFVNPYKSSEIAEVIKSLIWNKELSYELRMRGLRQAKRYSWENAIKKLASVYLGLLKDKF